MYRQGLDIRQHKGRCFQPYFLYRGIGIVIGFIDQPIYIIKLLCCPLQFCSALEYLVRYLYLPNSVKSEGAERFHILTIGEQIPHPLKLFQEIRLYGIGCLFSCLIAKMLDIDNGALLYGLQQYTYILYPFSVRIGAY